MDRLLWVVTAVVSALGIGYIIGRLRSQARMVRARQSFSGIEVTAEQLASEIAALGGEPFKADLEGGWDLNACVGMLGVVDVNWGQGFVKAVVVECANDSGRSCLQYYYGPFHVVQNATADQILLFHCCGSLVVVESDTDEPEEQQDAKDEELAEQGEATRLADEHRSAVVEASQAKEQAATWKAAAELACQTREGAQLLATERHTEAQWLRLENRQLRSEIEALRRRIIEEGNRAE